VMHHHIVCVVDDWS